MDEVKLIEEISKKDNEKVKLILFKDNLLKQKEEIDKRLDQLNGSVQILQELLKVEQAAVVAKASEEAKLKAEAERKEIKRIDRPEEDEGSFEKE